MLVKACRTWLPLERSLGVMGQRVLVQDGIDGLVPRLNPTIVRDPPRLVEGIAFDVSPNAELAIVEQGVTCGLIVLFGLGPACDSL